MSIYLLAFGFGVWLLQQQSALPGLDWLWALPLLATPFFMPADKIGRKHLLRTGLIALSCVAIGFAWAGWRAHLRMADYLPPAWQGIDVQISGVVASLPERDARSERFDFRVESILTPSAVVPGKIRLSWPAPQWGGTDTPYRIRAGERWQFTVRLKQPHGTINPDGFDYEAWLLARNLRATGTVRSAGKIRMEDRRLVDHLQALRDTVRARITGALGEHAQTGVIVALTVGDQASISHHRWRVFNRTGTSHLMSISGLHITLFAALTGMLVYAVWRRMPALVLRLPARYAALLLGWLAAVAYTALAGFQIPAQRTLFMLTVLVVSMWLQRDSRPFSLLVLALFVVLLIDPWAVLAPGFWLSFGAVAAMMLSVHGLRSFDRKASAWLRAQAAVTLALAPALLLLFQQVSLVSPLANALAIPVVSWGVVPLALLGMVFEPMWHLAAWLMQWVEQGLQWLAAFSWASLALPAPSVDAMVLALAGVCWLLMPGLPLRWLGGAMLLPLLFPQVMSPAKGSFEAEVLDVGQGTSVLIRTTSHTLLYDTGPPMGESDVGERIVLPRLRALGISRLDGLILTHDDLDHTGGAASVMRDMNTGWLMSSLPQTHSLLNRRNLRCARGQHWQWDGVRFEILNPPATAYGQDGRKDNDRSCVLRITQGRHSLLLTSDAERIGELEMTERVAAKLRSTVLMAGHHGSRTSSIAEFVAMVSPQHVVFSNGWHNRFGHPHADVLRRFGEMGSQAHRTDRQGWIGMRFTNEGVQFSYGRQLRSRYWQAAGKETWRTVGKSPLYGIIDS